MRIKSSSQNQNRLNLKSILKLSFILCAISALMLLSLSGCENSTTESPTYITNYTSEDSLTNPDVQLRVVFTNPANGTVGPFDGSGIYRNSMDPYFVIQFNKLIDLNNLNQDDITMAQDGELCTINISNYGKTMNNILVFHTNIDFLFNKVYTVTVDTTLEDIHGNRLKTPYVFSFTPEPYFRAYYGHPASESIPPVRNCYKIGILFNSSIDTTIFNSIHFTPPISGSWTFSQYQPTSTTMIIYSEKEDLLFDTKYTVSVSGDARDASGALIGQPYQFSFNTLPFQTQLSSHSAITAPGGFSTDNNFRFDFTGAIDTSSVRTSVSIEPIVPFHIFFNNYSQNEDIRRFYLTLEDSAMKPETLYTITLKKTISSFRGDFMKEDYVHQFTTGSIND